MSSETIDELRDYDLKIIQPKRGYRFSVDPLLLCEFAGICNGRIIDLGTGSGVIGLVMARKSPDSTVIAVDVCDASICLAERNILLNNLSERVSVCHSDILTLNTRFAVSSFDLVLSNPPYRKRGCGRISPHAGRDIGRHESTAGLIDFLSAAKYLVKPAGKICLIYHVSRLAELFSTAVQLNLTPLRMRMVHSDTAAEAGMVMMELAKGRRGELAILPPCFVRQDAADSHCQS